MDGMRTTQCQIKSHQGPLLAVANMLWMYGPVFSQQKNFTSIRQVKTDSLRVLNGSLSHWARLPFLKMNMSSNKNVSQGRSQPWTDFNARFHKLTRYIYEFSSICLLYIWNCTIDGEYRARDLDAVSCRSRCSRQTIAMENVRKRKKETLAITEELKCRPTGQLRWKHYKKCDIIKN